MKAQGCGEALPLLSEGRCRKSLTISDYHFKSMQLIPLTQNAYNMNSTDKRHHKEMLSIAVAIMGKKGEKKHSYIFQSLSESFQVTNRVSFVRPDVHARHTCVGVCVPANSMPPWCVCEGRSRSWVCNYSASLYLVWPSSLTSTKMSNLSRLIPAQMNLRGELRKLDLNYKKISSNGGKEWRNKVISVELNFQDYAYSNTTCLKRSNFFNTDFHLESAFQDHLKYVVFLNNLLTNVVVE